MLLPYQARWVADNSRVKVVEKSRRIGISWADAAASALDAAKIRGCDTYYVGYNKDMSEQYIEDVAYWARGYQLAASEIEQDVLKDDEEDILVFRVRFASGFKVSALSSRPSNLRAKKGKIVVDEAAFHQDFEQLIKAGMAILAWGGQMRIISTHFGASNPFNRLIEEIRAGEKDFSLHTYTIDDALIDGLFERIVLTQGLKMTREQWREQLFRDYGRFADEELLCIPTGESDSLFSLDAIAACSVGKWIGAREPAHYYLMGIDPNFGGADFFVAQMWDITKLPFSLVAEYRESGQTNLKARKKCIELIDKYKPTIVAIEANSGGTVIAENLASDRPRSRIELVKTTKTSKLIMTDRIALCLEQGEVVFPPDWEGIREMRQFSALHREAITGHDDCLLSWAIAFAYLEVALSSRKDFSWCLTSNH
ncbi:MAG: hypothetical protein KME30_25055 [Iphinoe sp. HA4291-MV1]|nr:hypothetical protein [Iphinoe sp. HA4291-MV1]